MIQPASKNQYIQNVTNAKLDVSNTGTFETIYTAPGTTEFDFAVIESILVGDDKSSAVYVDMKINACHRIGLKAKKILLPKSTTTDELVSVIHTLNSDADIYGILLQHPVPAHINERY